LSYPGTVTIPTPTTTDTPALNDFIDVASINFVGSGETITVGGASYVVVGNNRGNGYSLVLDRPVPNALPAGSIVKADVDGTKGRPGLEESTPTSSGSVVSVAFALIVALLALF